MPFMNYKETEISKRFRKISPNIFYDLHSAPAFIITLRLTMFMTGQTTIQDVLFFPQMRPEKIAKNDKGAEATEE